MTHHNEQGQLNEAVKRIAELAKGNEHGEWDYSARQNSWDYVVHSLENPHMEVCQPFHDGNTNLPVTKFIAAAPLMAATVAQQAAIIEQQRALLMRAREVIERIKVPHEMINRALTGIERASRFSNDAVISNTAFIRGFQKQIADGLAEVSNTLTAIDNLLISQHENNCKDALHPQVLGV